MRAHVTTPETAPDIVHILYRLLAVLAVMAAALVFGSWLVARQHAAAVGPDSATQRVLNRKLQDPLPPRA